MGVSVGSSIYKAPSIYESGQGGGGGVVIGGKNYKSKIMPDGKEWLCENLDYKFCNIGGGGIPTTPNAWYYNNNEADFGKDNKYKCGLLYNWYAAKFLDEHKNDLIPTWHVATRTEWNNLLAAMINDTAKKLKAADNSCFSGFPSSWNGTDILEFFVLPTGYYFGGFSRLGEQCQFWTPQETGSNGFCFLFDYRNDVSSNNDSKQIGFSLRLVRDP